jgi:hypothetical protein
MPVEFVIGGIYFPPLLIASILGGTATVLTARLLKPYRLYRFFYFPPLVFLAVAVIYTVLMGAIFVPF